MSTPPDDLDALRSRQPEAVQRWFETWADPVYAFVLHRVGRDPVLAADVAQDTFVTALGRIETFDPERGEMFPWLTYTARNCIRKAMRQQGRVAPVGDLWERLDERLADRLAALEEPLPQEVLERAETGELVRAVLSSLPVRYQWALRQHYFEHRSIRDMAANEGSSEGATRVLLHRARKAFRTAFEAVAETLAERPAVGAEERN
jgi:RNA polymerase sigma-70 factor (ECF subfamily)